MRLAWGRNNAGWEAVFSASRSRRRLNWLPYDGWPAALPRDERRLLHRRNDDREAAREAPLRPRESRRARICGMVAIQWAPSKQWHLSLSEARRSVHHGHLK